ncbi:MAG: VPLPA-CTERM sorting domain-containing protein [Gammaproteobacteria bacterium]|nr:VPLPA-CTERM sorting domain-containing protein [Gammaproteobacteria bacterium]
MKNLFVKAVLVYLAGASLQANAVIVTASFNQNDCSGYFTTGSGFDSCTVFVDSNGVDIELSPVIAKFGEDLNVSDINSTLFPSITGDEFTLTGTSANNVTGDWTYVNGTDDPGVRYWATKAGKGFVLAWEVDAAAVASGGVCSSSDNYNLDCLDAAKVVNSGSWSTPSGKDLSHITFYDTAAVPVPAAVWLLGSALGGLGFMRRKQQQKTARHMGHHY